jgi:hypothetical protein
MSKQDRKTRDVMQSPSHETSDRNVGLRHLLETDRMRLPDSPVEAFEQLLRAAIQEAGLHPPEVIEPDGNLHRFPSNGKRGDDAGWCVLHLDGIIPAGAFGDWRSGVRLKWQADIRTHASSGGRSCPLGTRGCQAAGARN